MCSNCDRAAYKLMKLMNSFTHVSFMCFVQRRRVELILPLFLMVLNLHWRTFFPPLADNLHTDDMFTPPQTLELLQRWQTVVHAEATPHSEISQQSFVSAVERLFKKEREKKTHIYMLIPTSSCMSHCRRRFKNTRVSLF